MTRIELMDTCAASAIYYKGWRDKLKYMADFGIEYVQTVLQVVRPQWPCVSPYRLVRGNEGDPKAIYDLTAWNSRYWDFLGEWVLTCRLYGMKAILALLSHPTARKLGYLPAYSYNVQGFKPDILACLSRPPSGAWLEILEAYAAKAAPYIAAAGGCLPLLEGVGTREFELTWGQILMRHVGSEAGVVYASSTISDVPEVIYSPHVKSAAEAGAQGNKAKSRVSPTWIETDGWQYETASSILEAGRRCIGKPNVVAFGSWLGGALCGCHRIVNGKVQKASIGPYEDRPLVTLVDCWGDITRMIEALGSLRGRA